MSCLYCFGPLPKRKGNRGKPRSKFCCDEHAKRFRAHGRAGDGKPMPRWLREGLRAKA